MLRIKINILTMVYVGHEVLYTTNIGVPKHAVSRVAVPEVTNAKSAFAIHLICKILDEVNSFQVIKSPQIFFFESWCNTNNNLYIQFWSDDSSGWKHFLKDIINLLLPTSRRSAIIFFCSSRSNRLQKFFRSSLCSITSSNGWPTNSVSIPFAW